MKWFLIAFKQYAVFNGRARRQEYWMFMLFSVIISVVTSILDLIFDTHYYVGMLSLGYINTLCQLVLFIPSLAVGIRRMHDVGNSGKQFWAMLACCLLLAWVYSLFSQSSTRAADSGLGIFFVLLTIAFLGLSIWVLVLLCREGDLHTNEYGPNPKDVTEQFHGDQVSKSVNADFPPPLPLGSVGIGHNATDTIQNTNVESYKNTGNSTLTGFIVSFSKLAKGEYWPLYEGNNPIGSLRVNQINLVDNAISEKHANINVSKDQVNNCWKLQIVDLSSAQGTELNGARIPIFSGLEINNSDRIKIGGYDLLLIVVNQFS
jgi:uncharacterized membrane protein YhaH (DUF805 family)